MDKSQTIDNRFWLRAAWSCLAAILMLACSLSAQATAPRISAGMFGEEKKADILQCRLDRLDTAVATEERLLAEILAEAFKAMGKSPATDVQPARQLAKYALNNGEIAALIGSPNDFTAKEKKRYRIVVFYLRGGAVEGEEVALIFSKSHANGARLHKAFDAGLRKLIASGRYLELVEAHHGKGKLPAGYVDGLKRHNPGWK